MSSPNQPSQEAPQNASQDAEPQSQHQAQPLPLPEPSPSSAATKIDVSSGGSTVKLDHLGPLVVNKDGTLSRINNWPQMTDIERQNTLRILGKRNMLRREALMEEQGESK